MLFFNYAELSHRIANFSSISWKMLGQVYALGYTDDYLESSRLGSGTQARGDVVRFSEGRYLDSLKDGKSGACCPVLSRSNRRRHLFVPQNRYYAEGELRH